MITLRHYDVETTTEDQQFENPKLLKSSLKSKGVNWINIEMQGSDAEQVNILMDMFHIDEQFKNSINAMICVEECEADTPLPTFDAVKKYSLFRLVMLSINTVVAKKKFTEKEIGKEQISLVGLHNVLISFQQGNIEGDVLEPVRDSIVKNRYQIREHGINHLFYLIMDVILDQYFDIVGSIREQIDDLEEQQEQYRDERLLMSEVMRLKKILRFLRRETIHLKKAFYDIKKNENFFSTDDCTMIYYDTISDHLNGLLSYYDSANDALKDLIDLNISLSGAQMNRIMKTLTLVSAVFIPLTFIAGLYGMNFEYMPELKWHYGYLLAVGSMAVIAGGTAFAMRKWF